MNVIVLTRFYLNGQSTHVFSLCSELRRQGHVPYLIAIGLNHPGYIKWLQQNKIRFSSRLPQYIPACLQRKYRFDIIHTHSAHTLKSALTFGIQLDLPVIATCHYLDFAAKKQLNKANQVIFISKEMQQRLANSTKNAIVIENGVDTHLFYPQQEDTADKPLALIVSRITETKEIGYAKMISVLQDKGWLIESIGDWQPQSQQKTGPTYHGWKVNIASRVNKADLVIGTGRAIREGMAAGCAALVLGDAFDGIVTPDNVSELRAANFSGRATKQEADYETIIAAIDALTPEKLKELQIFSRKYAQENFSLTQMTKEIIRVYQSCLAAVDRITNKSSRGESAINRSVIPRRSATSSRISSTRKWISQ